MKIQLRIDRFRIKHPNAAPRNSGFAQAQRYRPRSWTRNVSLVPIVVEGDIEAIGFQSSLRLAHDASVTHALVASHPLHHSRRVKLGLVPISELARLALPRRPSRQKPPNAGLDGLELVRLGVRRPFPIDQDVMWDLWQREDAWWRCRQDLTFFEASLCLWQVFGHKLYDNDDGDSLLDFLDIDFTTVGGPYQGHWGPLHGYKGPFPFTACFQIERTVGSQTRWILSIIDQVEDWYVGVVEDITPRLAALERQIRFELPEAQGPRCTGNKPGFQAGVFVQALGSRNESRTQLGVAK
ncbi:hypothetical protein [Mesorhizobium sp. BR1-1-2]|uniref:hypothetical protein n=1 Tax=Mesorhizobium sp. BR1-1-2 TaxID=2876652 RepID=UPI001CCDE24E|nr:hypothetical protein [Mesorhizobium sp. BR1-1-2]MBZ9965009.1 hypothetical protein [Mesorhizobium sp. BR1-1-2]